MAQPQPKRTNRKNMKSQEVDQPLEGHGGDILGHAHRPRCPSRLLRSLHEHEQESHNKHNPHDLFRLLETKQWDAVRIHLDYIASIKTMKTLVSATGRPFRFKSVLGLTCLGVAICYSAPFDIIDRIIQIDRTLPMKHDDYGLTVLHLGCLNGANPKALQYLLLRYDNLARELDYDGRCPLHHAVEFACCSISKNAKTNTNPSCIYIEMLKILCSADPEMVHAMDNHGITPLDMVQDEKASVAIGSKEHLQFETIYRILHSVSVKVYTGKKRQWERQWATLHRQDNLLLVVDTRTILAEAVPPVPALLPGTPPATKTTTTTLMTQQLQFVPLTKMSTMAGGKRRAPCSHILNDKRKLQATPTSIMTGAIRADRHVRNYELQSLMGVAHDIVH